MKGKSHTYTGYSTRSGKKISSMNKNIPHIKRYIYKDQEEMPIVWINLDDLVVCSKNSGETWFVGGIGANIGRNWLTY
jgi:hypothetical protein